QSSVLITLFCAYGYFILNGAVWNADSRLALTYAIVDRGTLTIDAYHHVTEDKSFHDGHYYTDKAPGLSFLAVPVYALLGPALGDVFTGQLAFVMRYVITLAVVAFPAAAFGAWLCGALGDDRHGAPILDRTADRIALALCYGLGTIGLTNSIVFYSHHVTAMLVFAAFALLRSQQAGADADSQRGGKHAGRAVSGLAWWSPRASWRIMLAGLLCGYAVITEFPAAIGAASIAVYALATGGYSSARAAKLSRRSAGDAAGDETSRLAPGSISSDRSTLAQTAMDPEPSPTWGCSSPSTGSPSVATVTGNAADLRAEPRAPLSNATGNDASPPFRTPPFRMTPFRMTPFRTTRFQWTELGTPASSILARLNALVWFTAGAVPPLLLLAWYNWAAFGSPFTLGYASLGGLPKFQEGMSRGLLGVTWPDLGALWGITFSPYRGLFLLSPWLLLAVPGVWLAWRRRPTEAALLAAVPIAYLLFNSAYFFWEGGDSLGPRHTVPALPFLAWASAYAWSRLRPVGYVLGLFSIVLVVVATATAPFPPPEVGNPLAELVAPALIRGDVVPNWGQLLGLPGAASLLPLAIVALTVPALALVPRPTRSRR
ncbi:MAG: hypothetical protein HY329_07640, partial [Chloroflexi bacterium]|nr:hypothetical protein [Chloroflexota bacterium]